MRVLLLQPVTLLLPLCLSVMADNVLDNDANGGGLPCPTVGDPALVPLFAPGQVGLPPGPPGPGALGGPSTC